MSDVLQKILATKREEVAAARAARPLSAVEAAAAEQAPARGFAAALDRTVAEGRLALICEIKKASPSAGLIRPDFDPAALAAAYEAGGATCLSVLTDRQYFQGDDTFVALARGACALPVLRKDFLVDPYQVAEARAIGADCILVIMAALSDAQAAELEDAADRYGLDVLIEVHDEGEMERALATLRSPLLGVNNRNLKTLEIDLAVTERLAPMLPPGRVLVAESGLKTNHDLARMTRTGARRFLIGESLMKQPDVAAATRALLAPVEA
ncbi:indole-3-glycerol phosphate synthase TrpC [Caenispirillum bisanense]|uniref:Indole-3-glycerol phosphate synthase n=1 Tax=Caenispirillum bisanense TaxID=414052 RepID=A0A286GF59_9PROT|nr:indole-3-glycerol phosphate synthase TrpC [Caenispirillum bisanense]SOD94161.1 indole-3-glycerol phosphate synthase [Caenispirillum bisanense]